MSEDMSKLEIEYQRAPDSCESRVMYNNNDIAHVMEVFTQLIDRIKELENRVRNLEITKIF